MLTFSQRLIVIIVMLTMMVITILLDNNPLSNKNRMSNFDKTKTTVFLLENNIEVNT